jgi:hypothetical protein
MPAPLYDGREDVPLQDPGVEHFDYWTHDYQVDPATRRIVGGAIYLGDRNDPGQSRKVEIGPPLLIAWTLAVGYGHPEWNHGAWRGELATGHERWAVDRAEPGAERYSIMHQVVSVSMDGQPGFGFVEQCILGPYPRYGLNA